MKKALIRLSQSIQHSLEFHLDAAQVEHFLLSAGQKVRGFQPDQAIQADRRRLLHLLHQLGLAGDSAPEQAAPPSASAGQDERMRWQSALQDGRVIQKGLTAARSGIFLDMMDNNGGGDFVAHNLESLLRHVEVFRQHCFPAFSPPLPPQEAWLERLDILILFSRHARRRLDLRYLNAVMKINESWFRHLSNPSHNRRFIRFAISLAEQEIAARMLIR